MGFEDKTGSKQTLEKSEETIESRNKAMTEAIAAGDYEKVAKLAQEATSLEGSKQEKEDDSAKESGGGNEKDAEGASENDAEDKEIETQIETSKEQIKGAAEQWIKGKEEKFEEKKKGFLEKFSGIGMISGGALAATIEAGLHIINNPRISDFINTAEQWEATVAVLAVGAAGAIAGGAIGKFADYLERRKLKNQNK